MKPLISFFIIFASISANAEALVCNPVEAVNFKILVVLDGTNQNAVISMLRKTPQTTDLSVAHSDAKYIVSEDGLSLKIKGEDTSTPTWSEDGPCYKMRKPTYDLSLDKLSDGSSVGSLKITNQLAVKPNVICKLPDVVSPSPYEIKCSGLKILE